MQSQSKTLVSMLLTMPFQMAFANQTSPTDIYDDICIKQALAPLPAETTLQELRQLCLTTKGESVLL